MSGPRLRVHALSMSLDGYVAGPSQDLEHPLGVGGEQFHRWIFATRTGRRVILGEDGGTTGPDDDAVAAGFDGIGATVMGRNMFGPVRGRWSDTDWRGWWGDEPPFGHDVFVLTHHAREPLEMDGGTTFHFVTEGPERALDLARAAAGDRDVRLGGGAATIRQYLDLGLVDELHLALVPALLGTGERLFEGGAAAASLHCTGMEPGDGAVHIHLARA